LNASNVDQQKLQTPLTIMLKGFETSFQRQVKRGLSVCAARCELFERKRPGGPDAIVFNQNSQNLRRYAAQFPAAVKVVYSLEALGKSWHQHLDNGIHIRMSTSMLSNQSEISVPFGCTFLRDCKRLKCQPDPAMHFKHQNRTLGWVASVISNPAQPRTRILGRLGKNLRVDNYGPVLKNKRSHALADRAHWGDRSKNRLFNEYPFAYVPENTWLRPWGYVTEKPYDAYLGRSLPIWQGGIGTKELHFFFPTTRSGRQPLLMVKDYPNWEDTSKLAMHIINLTHNPDEYAKYFDWDMEWFKTGPLARACEVGHWCKLCAAVHVMKQGLCPPFL